jgi:hypothetical protein
VHAYTCTSATERDLRDREVLSPISFPFYDTLLILWPVGWLAG